MYGGDKVRIDTINTQRMRLHVLKIKRFKMMKTRRIELYKIIAILGFVTIFISFLSNGDFDFKLFKSVAKSTQRTYVIIYYCVLIVLCYIVKEELSKTGKLKILASLFFTTFPILFYFVTTQYPNAYLFVCETLGLYNYKDSYVNALEDYQSILITLSGLNVIAVLLLLVLCVNRMFRYVSATN